MTVEAPRAAEVLSGVRSATPVHPICPLRPIVMTSVAIVAGMLPVAPGSGEGADFRAPLGRAVIGGVITSTFLTLLVIPTFYDMLSDWRSRFFALVRPKKVAAVVPEVVGK